MNSIADMPLDALLAAHPCVADFIAALGLKAPEQPLSLGGLAGAAGR